MYHVYIDDKFVGTITAEDQDKADSQARVKWGSRAQAIPIRYRSEKINTENTEYMQLLYGMEEDSKEESWIQTHLRVMSGQLED